MSTPLKLPTTAAAAPGLISAILRIIERVGNALPQPGTLFVLLSIVIVVASDIAARTGLEVAHPSTGQTIRPTSLLNLAGLHRMIKDAVVNFTSFPPFGLVLVAVLGIGVAEYSGLVNAVMRLLVISAPRSLLTSVIIMAAILSHAGSDIGYVLVIPLAATIFHAVGRHPLAGLAAAYAGVSGGFSANLLLVPTDALLGGLTESAAKIMDPAMKVNVTCNYYFLATSAVLLTVVGTFVTERIVEPRLGKYHGTAEDLISLDPLSPKERRGLLGAMLVALAMAVVMAVGLIPERGFLRNLTTGGLLDSPLISGFITVIFVGAILCGITYGVIVGKIRNDHDVTKGMAKAMETMAGFMVLVFFAAQFVAYFNWSNLGLVLAVKGAELIKSLNLSGIPLMLLFVFLTAFVNLFMGSASAKWAIMAPVFVPMFMILGYSPALTQAAFRVGDSCTNIITPMMSYFALIITFIQRYDPKAGLGTMVAMMLPYSVIFLIVWSTLLASWMALKIPLGF